MPGVGVTFTIGGSGNADATLKKVTQAANEAVKAENDLKKAIEERTKAADRGRQVAQTKALGAYYADPGNASLKAKADAATDRIRKADDDAEIKVLTERRSAAKKKEAFTKRQNEEEFKAIKKESDAATQRIADRLKIAKGESPAGPSTVEQAGAGLFGAGRFKGVGVGAGAALALAGGAAFMEGAGKVEKVQRDEYMTSEQRSRQFWKDMPITGWFKRIDDETSGRARANERVDEMSQINEARRSLKMRERGATLDVGNRMDAAMARVAAAGGMDGKANMPVQLNTSESVGGTGNYDRSTAGGRTEYKERLALMPLLEQANRAERDEYATKLITVEATKRQNQLEKEGVDLVKKRHDLNRAIEATPVGPGRTALISAAAQNESDIQGNIDLQRQQAGHVSQSKEAEAMAGHESRQKRIAVEQGKLGLLEGREERAADAQANIGMMGVGGRMQSMMALQIAQQYGLDALTPEMAGQAASIAPKTVRELAEKSGGRFNEQMRRIAPGDADLYQDLGEARGKTDDQRRKVGDMRQEDERKTAAMMAEAQKPLINSLKLFNDELKSLVDQLIKQLQLARAQKVG